MKLLSWRQLESMNEDELQQEAEILLDLLEQKSIEINSYNTLDPKVLAYDLDNIEKISKKLGDICHLWNLRVEEIETPVSDDVVDSSTSINASMDMGLTGRDDPLLYEFMYEYTKHYDELPDYDTVLDEWDESVSPRTWATAFNRLSDALENVKYHTDNGVQYIELSDNRTWYKIDVPEEVVAEIGEERVQKFYDDVIEWAKEEFYGKTGYDLYLLGRNGRHVCVQDDVQNALRYEYLKKVANDLENDVIFMMNDLSLEDIQ